MSLTDAVSRVRQLEKQRVEPPKSWSMSELYRADLPLVEGAVAGHVFVPQSVSLILGDFGCGKTWLALSLTASIALGRYWGHLVTKQNPALFLSEEMTPQEMQPRIRKLFTPQEIDALDPVFHLAFRAALKLESEDECKRLSDMIVQAGARFVIVDALRDVHRQDENDNNQMSIVFRNLRDLVATPTGSHVCLLHHTSKPSEFRKGAHRGRGAVVMMDVSADVLVIEKDAEGVQRVDFSKVRHGESPQSFGYKISNDPEDEARVLFEIATRTQTEEDQFFEAKKIKEALIVNGPMTLKQIMSALSLGKRSAGRFIGVGIKAEMFMNTAKAGAVAVYDVSRGTRLELMETEGRGD